jgi:hypothetical protein
MINLKGRILSETDWWVTIKLQNSGMIIDIPKSDLKDDEPSKDLL